MYTIAPLFLTDSYCMRIQITIYSFLLLVKDTITNDLKKQLLNKMYLSFSSKYKNIYKVKSDSMLS